jgi:hypothetical protein
MTQKRSDECVQPTEMWKNEILILGGERSMNGYKKLMDIVAMVEKTVLVVTMLLILVLTVGNVFSRKVIHQSWSFTEELVVAIFVLITLLGAALSAREGGLVGLNLVTERLPKSAKKPVVILITIFSVLFGNLILLWHGQGTGAACEPETYLCAELAGVDLLVLCTDRFGVHDSSFYRVLSR